MAKEVIRRRGTTAEHTTFTGAEGEVTVDTTKDTLVVHDGSTAGGFPLAKEAELATAGLPSGTTLLFHQSAAPTGWTKDTAATLDNAALRVVTSTAWASGKQGGAAFDSVFGSGKTAGSHTLTTAQMPSHTHAAGFNVERAAGAGGVRNSSSGGLPTGSTGGGGSHNHTLSLDLNYVNMIIATKD